MNIQRKSALPAATEVDADEGVAIAVVSVTGTVDEVKDIIEPGAYAKTLAARKPKVVWSHDWNTPIGRLDEVKELMPGDPNLPKTTANGEPWPAEAGALVIKARFNLETQRGREAFSDVKFYGMDGAWSIGYNVPAGGATVEQKTGIRRIKHLDLYEVSPVLHGAHALTSTLAAKALDGEEKVAALVCDECGGTEPEPDTQICARCGGPMTETGPGEEPAEAAAEEKASRRSLDRSPRSNWVEESGELPGYIREIARAIERDSGMSLSRAIAIAISRVKKWAAGGGDVNADTRAKAAAAVAAWEALKAKNAARDKEKSAPRVWKAKRKSATETKFYGPDAFAGSLEHRLRSVHEAITESFRPGPMQEMFTDSNETSDFWADVIATYDDHAVVSIHRDAGHSTYRVPYTVNADGSVAVGNPEEVELQTTLVPKVNELEVDETLAPADAAEKALNLYEAKAGRVLSTANAARLKSAVEELVKVLQAAGVDVNDDPPAEKSRRRTIRRQVKTRLREPELLELEYLKLAANSSMPDILV